MHSQARLRWDVDGADWPGRAFSRFESVDGHRFHVVVRGEGPTILLLHGAGAGGFSFRDLVPGLAKRAQVVAPDLPGQCFSEPAAGFGFGLGAMARATARLLEHLRLEVDLAVGHSAGAAILAEMVLAGAIRPRRLVGINPAMLPFDGWARHLFPPLARAGARSGIGPRLLAGWAARSPEWVDRTLRGTGSALDARGLELYHRLASAESHVAGTMAMMAAWSLEGLVSRLARFPVPLTLWVGANDRAVPPAQAYRIETVVPEVELRRFEGVGHLAHEEAPERFLHPLMSLTVA